MVDAKPSFPLDSDASVPLEHVSQPIPQPETGEVGVTSVHFRDRLRRPIFPFSGLTPPEAHKALCRALDPCRYAYKLGPSALKLSDSAQGTIHRIKTACKWGGMDVPREDSLSMPTEFTNEKIHLINMMEDPRFFIAPKVSMIYLYTEFLPQLLKHCKQSESDFDPALDASCVLDEKVLQYLLEQDAQHKLSDAATNWHPFFVDQTAHLDGENGLLPDVANRYTSSEIGEVAPVVNPIQYAMMLADAIVLHYNLRTRMSFYHHGQTALSGLDGRLISSDGRALSGSFDTTDNVLSLQMLPADKPVRSLILRPTVSL